MDHIAHLPGLDGQAFHLVDPKMRSAGDVINIFAHAGHAPQMVLRVDKKMTDMLPKGVLSYAMKLPALKDIRRQLLADLGIPDSIIEHIGLKPTFDARDTKRALAGSGIELPPLEDYADKLWDYWERNLDPDLFKDRSFEGAINGKTVIITGASSGIGLAAARKIAAAGGIPILVARSLDKLEEAKAEIERAGGTAYAYSCDLSDYDSIDALVEKIFSEHASIDMLVNNAGRSIRRSVEVSYDRFHDYERTIQLNYLGTIKLIIGVLPHMRETQGRPHRQRLLDRRPDQPAALLGLRRLQVGARRLHPRRVERDDRRQRDVHHDPHAAGAHADDRADEDLRQLPHDLARGGRRPGLRGAARQAQADQHPPRHVRRGRLRARAEGGRPDPPHGLQGLPGVDEEGQGRKGRPRATARAARRWRSPT